MTNLMDFIKDRDFSCAEGKAESFPEGKTALDLAAITVEEKEVEFDGKKRLRFVLTFGDKEYWAGTQIMEGIKIASEAGFSKVEVIRKGKGMATKYTVMGLKGSE